jgi:hypothetical protein
MTLLLIAPKLQARDCFFLVESKLIVFRHKTTRSRIGICQQNPVAASLADLSEAAAPVVKGKRSLLTSLFCGFRKRQLWIRSKANLQRLLLWNECTRAAALDRWPSLISSSRCPLAFLQLSIARSGERGSQNKTPTDVTVAAPPALSALSYPQKTRNHYLTLILQQHLIERERAVSLVPGSRTYEDARHAVASAPTNAPLLECN